MVAGGAVPAPVSFGAGPGQEGPSGSPSGSPSGDEPSSPKRRSLEALLREVRLEHTRAAVALRPKVAELVKEIDGLRASRAGRESRTKLEALERLGRPALELIVGFLDPGKKVTRKTVFRAQLLAGFLREHPDATTTDRLLALVRSGSLHGRLGALEALETTTEHGRVSPTLIALASGEHLDDLSKSDRESVRRAAFCTLAMREGPTAKTFIAQALRSQDPNLCAGALSAMAEAPAESTAADVLAFLQGLEEKDSVDPALASAIADYYEVHADLLIDVDHARALGAVVVIPELPSEPRTRIFDALRVTDAKVGTKVKRAAEPFADMSRPELRMAARLFLARLKDRGAKRDLLDPFDDEIKRNKNSIAAHSDRAKIYHAIGEYGAAERDWRFVMEQMAKDDLTRSRKEPFIGIARALARLKKYREAASYLSQGPISVDELKALGKERDFLAMAETRYGDIFQFGDD